MIQSPHITTAIRTYERQGEDFHDVMTWHLVHGLVMACMEFLCVGYFCRKDNIKTPVPKHGADTVFVSFMAGSMPDLKSMAPNIEHIAFKRGFKNTNPVRIYRMDRLKQLIN